MRTPSGPDAQGESRTIPVRIGGAHRGLVVWHTREELERFWRGTDREASRDLGLGGERRHGA
jgi:hypothetical protein